MRESNSEVGRTEAHPWRLFHVGLVIYALFSGFSISGSQIGLSLALIGALHDAWLGKFRPDLTRVESAYTGLFLVSLISLTYAIDLGRGITELTKFLMLAVYWLLAWTRPPQAFRRTLLILIVFSGALSAYTGLFKTFVWEGLSYRSSGFFSMPLTFSECQMLYFLVTLVFSLQKKLPLFQRGLLIFALCGQGGALIGSFSRGAFIGLFVGVFCLFRKSWKVLVFSFFIILLLLAGALYFSPNMQRKGVLSFSSESPDSLRNIRFRIWRRGFEILQFQPVFGVGLNNVKPHYKQLVTQEERNNNQVFGHLHNSFYQFLIMTGFAGFLCFLWFALEMGRTAAAMPDLWQDSWWSEMSKAAFPLWMAFMASGLTEYSFADEEVAMLCFFLLGLLAPSPQSCDEGISTDRMKIQHTESPPKAKPV